MRRSVLVILLLLTFSLSAQQAKFIKFREEVFDFGSVKEDGGPVLHEFLFTNTTNRPIRVLTVQASCGCTTPAWTNDPVAPGKTGFIQASYDPKGRPGFFNKTLTVTTDFEATPIVLQIKGNVSTDGVGVEGDFQVVSGNWKFKSSAFNLGKVHLNEEATVRDFPFFNAGTAPVSVSKVVSPDYITVDVSPKTIGAKEKGNIKITYNGKKRNRYGFQNDNVEVHTDDPVNPVKSFTVYATLEDYFGELTPEDMAKAPRLLLGASSMDFGRVGKNATMKRELNITNTGKNTLTINSVQANCSCVTTITDKKTLAPGESSVIRITFNAQDRKATQQKAVTIYSNDPQNPVQRFTFTAYVEE